MYSLLKPRIYVFVEHFPLNLFICCVQTQLPKDILQRDALKIYPSLQEKDCAGVSSQIIKVNLQV